MSDLSKKISQQICGKDEGCTKDDSDIKKAEKISFTLYNNSKKDDIVKETFEIEPKNYINYDKDGKIVYHFKDIEEIQKLNKCKNA